MGIFKDVVEQTKKEIAANRSRIQSETAVRMKINGIKDVLEGLQSLSDKHLQPEIEKTSKEFMSQLLWDSLPDSIVGINYGAGTITRETKLPENERITWSLKQIDDHAAMLAKQIGQPWKPVIKS